MNTDSIVNFFDFEKWHLSYDYGLLWNFGRWRHFFNGATSKLGIKNQWRISNNNDRKGLILMNRIMKWTEDDTEFVWNRFFLMKIPNGKLISIVISLISIDEDMKTLSYWDETWILTSNTFIIYSDRIILSDWFAFR